MLTIDRVEVNTERLRDLQSAIQDPDALVELLAQNMVADIGENWNATSPAPEGEAPGIDTGALAGSIRADRLRPGLWAVRDGVEYGIYLEIGAGIGARPFMMPAAQRVFGTIPGLVENWVGESV